MVWFLGGAQDREDKQHLLDLALPWASKHLSVGRSVDLKVSIICVFWSSKLEAAGLWRLVFARLRCAQPSGNRFATVGPGCWPRLCKAYIYIGRFIIKPWYLIRIQRFTPRTLHKRTWATTSTTGGMLPMWRSRLPALSFQRLGEEVHDNPTTSKTNMEAEARQPKKSLDFWK